MGRFKDLFNEPLADHPLLVMVVGITLGVIIDAALIVLLFSVILG